MENEKKFHFQGMSVPGYMRDGLVNYVSRGAAPGGFLSAILKNDLKSACYHADDENMRNIPAYVNYLYNYAPCDCWGSEKNFKAWVEVGGLEGREASNV